MITVTIEEEHPANKLRLPLLPVEVEDLGRVNVARVEVHCDLAKKALANFAEETTAAETRHLDLGDALMAVECAVMIFEAIADDNPRAAEMARWLGAIGNLASKLALRALRPDKYHLDQKALWLADVQYSTKLAEIVVLVVMATRQRIESIEELVSGLTEFAWYATGASDDAIVLAEVQGAYREARHAAVEISRAVTPVALKLFSIMRQLEAEDQLGQLG